MKRRGGLSVARRSALAALALALLAAGVGTTVAAFTATTTNPAGSFTANATFPPVWVRNVGSASCGGTSSAVTVPAGGIPVGRTLIAQVVLRGGSYTAAVSLTDSRGNAYTLSRDQTNTGSQVRTLVYSGYVGTALLAGDTITVSHGNSSAEGMAVDEVRRLPQSGAAVAVNGANGTSNQPSVTVTPTAGDRLVYGGVGLAGNQAIATEAGNFSPAHDVLHNCGGAASRARNHAAYRIVASGTSFTYDPQLSASVGWVDAGIAYTG